MHYVSHKRNLADPRETDEERNFTLANLTNLMFKKKPTIIYKINLL